MCLLVASLFRVEERGSRFLQIVSKFIPAYTASHSRQHFCWVKLWFNSCVYYRGTDKSLAQPGRTQATATEDFDVHTQSVY